jgi:hypothetical protein
VICKNRDHGATGIHDDHGVPLGPACSYDSCYAWAYANQRDSVFTKAIRADHVRNFGAKDAVRIEFETNAKVRA